MRKFLLTLVCLMFSVAAFAQANKTNTSGMIPDKVINDMFESCKYHIPPRFTPDAREYYCACNSAAVKANFKMDDYQQLKNKTNFRAGNKVFEKYVETAILPCLDMPVEQIEYLSCMVDHPVDARVAYVPRYCTCIAKKLQAHAMKFADAEIIMEVTRYPDRYSDPVEALWANADYIRTQSAVNNSCILNPNNP